MVARRVLPDLGRAELEMLRQRGRTDVREVERLPLHAVQRPTTSAALTTSTSCSRRELPPRLRARAVVTDGWKANHDGAGQTMTAQDETSIPPRPAADDDDDGLVISRSLRDPEQFAVVFRRHAPQIQRYVLRRVGVSAADDLVAETFLTAFRQRASYQPGRPDAGPWLYGIATHLIGRHRRAEIRLYRALARTGTDPVTEPFTDRVDERVSASGASRRLAAALMKLPAGHRDVLLLTAWGDLTYEQVAVALDVPVGTVRSRLSRARSRLRRALGEPDPAALSDEMTPADGRDGGLRRPAGNYRRGEQS
jgi:RNA polymerase sigma factor (sigma-70 family)